jgi:hypothetical protein
MTYDNDTLEAAAQLLERLAGNSLYQSAWRAGAKRIRNLKNANEAKVLNDERGQISAG